MKIMASGPTTSWEIHGETVETVSDFIFWGPKISADGDCSHEIKRRLLLGRKVMTNLDSIFKSRDFTLPTKVHLVKAMVFPVDWKSDWTELKCYHWQLSRSRLVRELTAWIQRMISVTISWTEGYAEGKQLRKQVGLLFPLQFSHSVVSDTLQPQKSQHAMPPCPSPTPRV